MSKLKIAIQKNGRLNQQSLQLLKDCGLNINNGKDQLKVTVENFPLEILYLRNSDIPQYLEDGTADLGIVGENLLIEKQKQVSIVKKLGFSKCRVSLAVPKEVQYNEISYFNNKKIATSYPATLQKFLKEKHKASKLTEEDLKEILYNDGIDISIEEVNPNSGMRMTIKIILNALWDKFAQKVTLLRRKYFENDEAEFSKFLNDSTIEIHGISLLHLIGVTGTLQVTHRMEE